MAAGGFVRITVDSVSWLLGHKQGGGGGQTAQGWRARFGLACASGSLGESG